MTAWGVVGAQAYLYGNPRSHQWYEQWELKGDYTMRYFIEPVALVAAYAKSLGCEDHHNTLSRLTTLDFHAASLADEILCGQTSTSRCSVSPAAAGPLRSPARS